MKLFNKIKEIYFKPVKIKSELDGMKKQNTAKERAYRERLVIQLSPQMRGPLYSPGLSSRMQFKSPMGSGIVKHLGGVWIPFFNHSISVTHHSKYLTYLEPSLTCHYSIFFTLFVGPIPVTRCSLFFFFQYH